MSKTTSEHAPEVAEVSKYCEEYLTDVARLIAQKFNSAWGCSVFSEKPLVTFDPEKGLSASVTIWDMRGFFGRMVGVRTRAASFGFNIPMPEDIELMPRPGQVAKVAPALRLKSWASARNLGNEFFLVHTFDYPMVNELKPVIADRIMQAFVDTDGRPVWLSTRIKPQDPELVDALRPPAPDATPIWRVEYTA